MNDFLNFANEVHVLMHKQGQLVFQNQPDRLQHFFHVAAQTSEYILRAHTEGRSPDVERTLADGWETIVVNAAVDDPRFSLVCADIVNFWRASDAFAHGKPFSESALMFLAMKFTRFE